MINSKDDLKFFLKDIEFQKIFVLYGRNSFSSSGAQLLFKDFLKNKTVKYFSKYYEIPKLEELILIINAIKEFKPDLIVAVGGGTIIDYAKIGVNRISMGYLTHSVKNFDFSLEF